MINREVRRAFAFIATAALLFSHSVQAEERPFSANLASYADAITSGIRLVLTCEISSSRSKLTTYVLLFDQTEVVIPRYRQVDEISANHIKTDTVFSVGRRGENPSSEFALVISISERDKKIEREHLYVNVDVNDRQYVVEQDNQLNLKSYNDAPLVLPTEMVIDRTTGDLIVFNMTVGTCGVFSADNYNDMVASFLVDQLIYVRDTYDHFQEVFDARAGKQKF